jgi:hypothetical protein
MSWILLWLLPVVDVFSLGKILSYYSSLGVEVPIRHAYLGMAERWVGYLPIGFFICWYAGLLMVLIVALAALALVGPLELCLMWRGFGPWKFFRGKPRRAVTKIFLLEAYNMLGYFLLGALLELLIFA